MPLLFEENRNPLLQDSFFRFGLRCVLPTDSSGEGGKPWEIGYQRSWSVAFRFCSHLRHTHKNTGAAFKAIHVPGWVRGSFRRSCGASRGENPGKPNALRCPRTSKDITSMLRRAVSPPPTSGDNSTCRTQAALTGGPSRRTPAPLSESDNSRRSFTTFRRACPGILCARARARPFRAKPSTVQPAAQTKAQPCGASLTSPTRVARLLRRAAIRSPGIALPCRRASIRCRDISTFTGTRQASGIKTLLRQDCLRREAA